MVKVEEEFLTLKIKQLQESVDISVIKIVSETEDYVTKMEGFIENYFGISEKLKCCLGGDYDDLYGSKFFRN